MSKQKKSIITYVGKGFQVKLRGKRKAKGMISLYLDYYLGTTKDENGKTKDVRKIEFLKTSIKDNPQSIEERDLNKKNLEYAYDVRLKRESALKHNSEGLLDPNTKTINFIDYYQSYLDSYKNKDIRIVKYSFEKFKLFVDVDFIQPYKITEDLVKDFKRYLESNLNGETPYNYFAKFKQVCKEATKKRIFDINPADEITITRPTGLKKEILSIDEVKILAKAECGNPIIKDAFLFCLNTGLRHCDVKDLQWKHIDFDNRRLQKKQTKVKDTTNPYVYIDLNSNSLSILGRQNKRKPDDYIFPLPTIEGSSKTLKNWVKRAGIEKNITWHSARHSFATILLSNNANIKTVSSLLGHSDLKHTQKYTHVVNELKRKAVDSLPKI